MKLIFSILFILLSSFLSAQTANQGMESSSFKRQSLSTVAVVSRDMAIIQSDNWKQQVQLTPTDANAWINYYNWLDRNNEIDLAEKNSQLIIAVANAKKYISKSWQFALMLYLQSGKSDSTSLFSSLDLAVEKGVIYPYVIQFALIKDDKIMLEQYCMAMNNAVPMSPGMYEYHFNTLMSAEQNAVIYAKGLNDLVPLAILQQVYHVRKDIRLKYYGANVKVENNAYLCLSVGQEILSQYPNGVYTGLLVKMKKDGSAPEMEKHILEKFSLSYLKAQNSLPEDEQLIYRNYLPSFILLYKNIKAKGQQQAEEWKALVQKLAQITRVSETVNKILLNK